MTQCLNRLPLKFIFHKIFFIHGQLQSFPTYAYLPIIVFRGCDFGFFLAATFINFLSCITQLQLVIFLYFVLWAGGLNPEWLGHKPEVSNRTCNFGNWIFSRN